MSAITSAERFVFLDRLMSRPWLSQAVMSLDNLACFALDTIDASWDVIKEPVTEVAEFAAFSSLGQFTIGCLESSVNITANILDVVLPVKATDDEWIGNEDLDHGHKAKKRPVLLSLDSKKKPKSRERRVAKLQPIRTVSTFTIQALRNLQKTLNSLKHCGDHEFCGNCTKRRKVVALRRLGPLHSLAHLSFDAFTTPMKLVGLNVSWDGLKCVFTLSGNDRLNKSPVRPKSATEKRRYTELSSSDEEEIDDIHRFHDDLDDYQSDEDEDYQQPEICCQESDSDEYAAGETESDVSLDESPAPLKPREAKMAAKMAAKKGYEDIPEGFIRPSNKKNDKKKSLERGASKESPAKGANKLGGKDSKTTSDKENKGAKMDANEKGVKDATSPRKGSGSSVDTRGENTGAVNGQKINKDLVKITNEGKKGPPIKAPLSPLRKLIGV